MSLALQTENDPLAYRPRVVDRDLAELLSVLPAVSIEGPRAAGKTRTACEHADTVYNLDDPDVLREVSADPRMLLEGRHPILIDEWQRFPPSWDLVRRAVDDNFAPGRFILTGSVRPGEAPTHSGAGRIVTLRMWTMTLSELWGEHSVSLRSLLSGDQQPLDAATEVSLEDYADVIVGGGFPGWHTTSGRARRLLVDGYLHRIVEHDLPLAGRAVRNPAALRYWLQAYAAATSTTASYESIRDAATAGEHNKPAKTTTSAYRDALQALWVLEPLPAWLPPTGNRLSRLKRSPKHHLTDTSLAVRLLGVTEETLLGVNTTTINPQHSDKPIMGALFESLVTRDLRVYAQSCDSTVCHLRSWSGAREVDLIVGHEQGILAIEVKLASEVQQRDTQHLQWLRDRIGPALLDAVVVTTGSRAYRDNNGIAIIPAALLGP
ncbi:MAG: DUF4143 domain-containing protein [Acidimicrobiaceae bacterium]|nr:DUF4143 domain-containing protein [Acidimicrobiaceae bacterium]